MQYHTYHTSSLYYYHQTQNKSVFSLLFLLSVLFCVARFSVFLTSNVIKHTSIIIFYVLSQNLPKSHFFPLIPSKTLSIPI